MNLDNKKILITGGTGSLGKILTKRLLSGEMGKPQKIIIFSRDEAKQHYMRCSYLNKMNATDDITYKLFKEILSFQIGDIRDFHSVATALREADVVFNTAALKQVPACEYAPEQAVKTNILGVENIVTAIKEYDLPVNTVIGISTDKACKPVNVMGMTKAIQERVFISGNLKCPKTRFICVRYGNVLASRGSVIPLFHEQIRNGGPVTITTKNMTRFLLTLNQAVDTVFAAFKEAQRGEIYIPNVKSCKVIDIANALIGKRKIRKEITGIRPGEKIHEILVSEEETHRTIKRGSYYVILSNLPELRKNNDVKRPMEKEFSSAHNLMGKKQVERLLKVNKLMVEDKIEYNDEDLLA
jgi:FlaA1/EpsC-like NDP-sugar epimerase